MKQQKLPSNLLVKRFQKDYRLFLGNSSGPFQENAGSSSLVFLIVSKISIAHKFNLFSTNEKLA